MFVGRLPVVARVQRYVELLYVTASRGEYGVPAPYVPRQFIPGGPGDPAAPCDPGTP
jgi:hypothetical protein